MSEIGCQSINQRHLVVELLGGYSLEEYIISIYQKKASEFTFTMML